MFTEIVAVGTKHGIQVYDLRRGTRLAQGLGVGVGGRQGFCLTDTWVAAVNEKKPVCHVYMLNRGDTGAKIVFPFPEEIVCLHAIAGGKYLAAGAKSGRVLIWATASGRLLRAWDAHYGAVTSLTSSEGVLLSGGEDAAVHVWALSQALDQIALGESAVTPIVSLTGHTMAITALQVGQAGLLSGKGRVYTAGRDHTCKQWRLRVEHDGEKYVGRAELLNTLLYPATVNDIAVDKGETRVFAATAAGIYQTNMFAYKKTNSDSIQGEQLAALGGSSDAVFSETHIQYPSAEKSVVAVSLSYDGSLLVSAALPGTVRIWDTASRQCMRTISDKQLGTGVTQLCIRLAPPQLGGPKAAVSVGLHRPEVISEQAIAPKLTSISFAPLQRLAQESGARTTTAFEATVKAPLADSAEDMASFDAMLNMEAPYSQTARADAWLLDSLRPTGGSAEKQVADVLQQMELLQRHHARTRRLNDELYQGAVSEWLNLRQKK
ncbi:Pre-rRNA-processing protein ipi3 [Coemansia aciculifera]|uniref:Pre-rRNA-processing protein ipi3 n=1 Tax=Coemansia aciculifera TaxID=417176 RepID=A0ACC1M384_9FUNG|nr:Pre-rRNA-processing protein ipi3 [Coemansia aciculifera]KAJ2910070.1 Pre-rRNA-processing protein ipi3 [Coemansia aciculifera]